LKKNCVTYFRDPPPALRRQYLSGRAAWRVHPDTVGKVSSRPFRRYLVRPDRCLGGGVTGCQSFARAALLEAGKSTGISRCFRLADEASPGRNVNARHSPTRSAICSNRVPPERSRRAACTSVCFIPIGARTAEIRAVKVPAGLARAARREAGKSTEISRCVRLADEASPGRNVNARHSPTRSAICSIRVPPERSRRAACTSVCFIPIGARTTEIRAVKVPAGLAWAALRGAGKSTENRPHFRLADVASPGRPLSARRSLTRRPIESNQVPPDRSRRAPSIAVEFDQVTVRPGGPGLEPGLYSLHCIYAQK
jgi:hypothetical protein